MFDDIGPLTFLERVARLEERSALILPILDEIQADQKKIAATIARAGGAVRVLLMLGTLVGVAGAVHRLADWATMAAGAMTGGA